MARYQVSYSYILQNWMLSPSPPDTTGSKSGFAWQLARGDHQYISTTRGGEECGERRTTAAPVYCRGCVAVSGAREVGERSLRFDLAGAECSDTVTLDCGCVDESGKHESGSGGRRPQQNHECRDENGKRRCAGRMTCKHFGLYRMRYSLWASSEYYSFRSGKDDRMGQKMTCQSHYAIAHRGST